MIIVDSSIWIDYFNDKDTLQTTHLDFLLGEQEVGIGDIILTEVLQGFSNDKDYQQAKSLMLHFDVFPLLGQELAIISADNYRFLRKKGLTVRKTTDVIIASFCIHHNYPLLFSDKDFQPFVEHLSLRPAFAH